MEKKNFFGNVITVVLLSLFVFAACNNPRNQRNDEQLRQDSINQFPPTVTNDEPRDFNQYSYSERDQFTIDANRRVDDLNREIDDLKSELDNVGDTISANTRTAYQRSITELERLRDDLKTNVDKAQNSTEDTWEKTKTDVANAYNKAKENIEKGWNDFKRGVNKQVNNTNTNNTRP